VAKVFPGGSTVTRGFPAALAGGGGAGDLMWVEALSVDWTGVSHDFETTAEKAIGGVDWECLNNGSGIQAGGLKSGDGGDGLRIWPAGTERIWDGRVDAPMVTCLVKDAVGAKTTYDMNKHAVCFQCTYTSAQDISNNYDAIGAICMNSAVGTSPTDPRYLTARCMSSGTVEMRSIQYKTTDGHSDQRPTANTVVADRNLFQVIIWPGQDYIGTIVGSIGVMPGGGFPDPNDFAPGLTGAMDLSTKGDGSTFTLANLRVGMFAVSEGSAPDPNPIFTKCRVMYMEMF
jgi:hypothetical protein